MFKDFFVLQVEGISIVGQVFLPGDKGRFPAVCLCHGVPSGGPPDPSDGSYPVLAERICREGYAVFFFNFRGTGESGGNMDIAGWVRDLETVVDYVYGLDTVDEARLFLVGFSAGAAVSIYIASRDTRIAGMVACASPADFSLFTSRGSHEEIIRRYRDIGAIRDADFPPSIEDWFNDMREVTPMEHVAGISPRPLLVLHGSLDEVVPVNDSRRLYREAGEPKKLVIITGAGHKLRRVDEAIEEILGWLGSYRR